MQLTIWSCYRRKRCYQVFFVLMTMLFLLSITTMLFMDKKSMATLFQNLKTAGNSFSDAFERDHPNVGPKSSPTPRMQRERAEDRQSVAVGLTRREPHRHVYYLKTHKTGSSTAMTIFAEYSRSHDLLPLMPVGNEFNHQPPFKKGQLLLLGDSGQKYDLVFNHHIYSPEMLKYVHNDSFRVTSIREPYRHLISALNFYKLEGYIKRIPGEDQALEYLKAPYKYELPGYQTHTNNRQSIDLGYDLKHSMDDTAYIKDFVKLTASRFDLALITEYFLESLVVMKRTLHWYTQDILYIAKRVEDNNNKHFDKNEALKRKLFMPFFKPDTALYNHFLGRLRERMAEEVGIEEEIAETKKILDEVWSFCHQTYSDKTLSIPSGKWTDSIHLMPSKCVWLKMYPPSFTKHLQRTQRELFAKD